MNMVEKDRWRGTLTCNRGTAVLQRIRKRLCLRILIVSCYLLLWQRLAARICVFVEESRCIDGLERVTTRGTPTRICIGEGRLPKSLLTERIRHYSPWATCTRCAVAFFSFEIACVGSAVGGVLCLRC